MNLDETLASMNNTCLTGKDRVALWMDFSEMPDNRRLHYALRVGIAVLPQGWAFWGGFF